LKIILPLLNDQTLKYIQISEITYLTPENGCLETWLSSKGYLNEALGFKVIPYNIMPFTCKLVSYLGTLILP
jgi:hypothetical protein